LHAFEVLGGHHAMLAGDAEARPQGMETESGLGRHETIGSE
jgi:hypothetical protein